MILSEGGQRFEQVRVKPDEQITVIGGEFRTNLEKRSYRISGDLCLGSPFMGKSTDVAVCRWRWYGRYQMVCLPRDVDTVVDKKS